MLLVALGWLVLVQATLFIKEAVAMGMDDMVNKSVTVPGLSGRTRQSNQDATDWQQSTDWLIDGFIPANSLGIIYGYSCSFKSFIALDMCCCVANQIPWQGLETKQGAAYYLTGEGGTGIAKRLQAWRVANDNTAHHFHSDPGYIDLFDGRDRQSLYDHLKGLAIENNMPFKLIIIDTLAQVHGQQKRIQCTGHG